MKESSLYDLPEKAVCLFDINEVTAALGEMAASINNDYAIKREKPVIVMPIMTGAIFCVGVLLPKFSFPLTVDYIHASRYQNNRPTDEIRWLHQPTTNLHGRDVLLIDDILDHGVTLQGVVDYCYAQGAMNVRTAVMLKKNVQFQALDVDYWSLTTGDYFVFGCGMDVDNLYRNAAGIFYQP